MSKFEFINFKARSDKQFNRLLALLEKVALKLEYALPDVRQDTISGYDILMTFTGLWIGMEDNAGISTRLTIGILSEEGYNLWKMFVELGFTDGGPYKKRNIFSKTPESVPLPTGKELSRRPPGRHRHEEDVWVWEQIYLHKKNVDPWGSVWFEWQERINKNPKRCGMKDRRNRFLKIIKPDWMKSTNE